MNRQGIRLKKICTGKERNEIEQRPQSIDKNVLYSAISAKNLANFA
jgi:hypothetical protein